MIEIRSTEQVIKALAECFGLEHVKGYQVLSQQIYISENADFFIYSHPKFWTVSGLLFPDDEIKVYDHCVNGHALYKTMTFSHGELIRAELEICTYADDYPVTPDLLEEGNFTFHGFSYPSI